MIDRSREGNDPPSADSATAAPDLERAAQLRAQRPDTELPMWERVQELQRAINARDEFIATVAHELRNPIAPLTLQVRLALNKVERLTADGEPIAADWVQSQLRGIERRFDRLLETLDRLLDMSRLSTGRIDLQLEPVVL
jgi:signal transduction histidine kinase